MLMSLLEKDETFWELRGVTLIAYIYTKGKKSKNCYGIQKANKITKYSVLCKIRLLTCCLANLNNEPMNRQDELYTAFLFNFCYVMTFSRQVLNLIFVVFVLTCNITT